MIGILFTLLLGVVTSGVGRFMGWKNWNGNILDLPISSTSRLSANSLNYIEGLKHVALGEITLLSPLRHIAVYLLNTW